MVQFGDGLLTARGTFQKFFEQAELKSYIETVLEAEAIPAGLGIFYVFKDETRRQQFLANRFRRRDITPRPRMSELRFEENREMLDAFMAVLASFGRVPDPEEWPQAQVVAERFGSLKRAFAFVKRFTGSEAWDLIARRRREDILVYLALARFRRRPNFSALPPALQRDMRAFFGSYAKACAEADALLFEAGNAASIDDACGHSRIGKILPDDLYVHTSALDSLEPILRIYEGCGRAYLGEVEGANVIKLHRRSGKISYLAYPDFEINPHPALVRCVRLSLRTRELDCYDYCQSANPPILHRKETFLARANPLYEKFAELTQQEEKHGLLSDPARIGTRLGWENRLNEVGFALRGHRLIRRAARQSRDNTYPEAPADEV